MYIYSWQLNHMCVCAAMRAAMGLCDCRRTDVRSWGGGGEGSADGGRGIPPQPSSQWLSFVGGVIEIKGKEKKNVPTLAKITNSLEKYYILSIKLLKKKYEII